MECSRRWGSPCYLLMYRTACLTEMSPPAEDREAPWPRDNEPMHDSRVVERKLTPNLMPNLKCVLKLSSMAQGVAPFPQPAPYHSLLGRCRKRRAARIRPDSRPSGVSAAT